MGFLDYSGLAKVWNKIKSNFILKNSVSAKSTTLTWNTETEIANIDGKSIKIKIPSNPNTNTTYTFAEGTTNGAFSVTPSSGSAQSVPVHGVVTQVKVGTTEYNPSSGIVSLPAYPTKSSWNYDDRYLKLSGGGTVVGEINVKNSGENSSRLRFVNTSAGTYIESGNDDFTDNKPLYITGKQGQAGSDLYLNFTNVYYGNGSSTNKVLHSGSTLDATKLSGTIPAACYTNSRDAGFGKITPGAASTAVTAPTSNTTQVLAATYNENITFTPSNKWIGIGGSNSTSGNDVVYFGHALSGITAGTAGTSSATSGSTLAVPYLTLDAAGHVTAYGTHTHTITGFAASSHDHERIKPTRYDTDDPAPNTKGAYLTFQFSNINSKWWNVLNMRSYTDNNYVSAELLTPANNPGSDTGYSGDMMWRQGRNSTWLGMRTILDSENYTTYINTSNFPGLDKTGTITQVGNTTSGAVTVSSSNNTAAFGSAVTVGSVGGVDLKFTMPGNPNSDTKVTQTVTTSTSHTSWRPLILGHSSSDAAVFAPTTVTDTTFASHLAKFKPSAGLLALVGLNKLGTDGKIVTGSDTTVWNTNGGTTSLSSYLTAQDHYKTSPTAGSYGMSDATTGNNGTKIQIPYITVDANGHVTSISNKEYTAVVPTVNNGTLSLMVNETAKNSFTANSSGNVQFTIADGTSTSGNGTFLAGGAAVSIYGLKGAAYKEVDETTMTSTSTKLPTSKAVAAYVSSAMTSVLSYKGTIGTGGDITTLPASHKVGDVYVVSTAGTYAGKACEVGDYIICKTAGTSASDAHWDVVNGENQVENKSASLAAAGSSATIATVDGTNLTITTPSTWAGVAKTGTVTKVSTGVGLVGGDITTTGTLKVKLKDETANGSDSSKSDSTNGGLYAVEVDKSGYLAVRVPWTDHTYTVNNGSLYLQANGTTKTTFTANQSGNSTFNIATGSTDGSISVAGVDVAVKGLGDRAFDSTSYLPLSGGTVTGSITVGQNAIVFNNSTSNDWSNARNAGIRILNTVGASVDGAPSNYSVALSVSGYYGFQMACCGATSDFRLRHTSNGSGTPGSWVNILCSDNWSSYVTLSSLGAASSSHNHDSTYLKLSGGTMTGPLKWNDATALPVNSSPQYFLCIDAFASGGTTKYASKAATLQALTGLTSTAVGDADEPVYWSGSAFTKCGPFSSSSHDHNGVYVKLDAGTSEQTIKSSIASMVNGSLEIWRAVNNAYPMIGFSNGTTKTRMGFLGFGTTANQPIFRTTGGADYNLIHAGNYTTYCAKSDHTHTTTIATSNGTNQLTLANGSKYALTAGGTSYVFTMPAGTGSTNSNSKLYLIGSTTQAAASTTYSDSEVYTTNGTLTTKSVQVGGGSATIQYNSTNQCIEFVFN